VSGDEGGGGGEGIFESFFNAWYDEPSLDAGASEAGAAKLSGGDSTCCGVELKNRARTGRRNVGGSADDGIRVSRMDRLIVLLSIVTVELPVAVSNCWKEDVDVFEDDLKYIFG
jgi:hypothetical protein